MATSKVPDPRRAPAELTSAELVAEARLLVNELNGVVLDITALLREGAQE